MVKNNSDDKIEHLLRIAVSNNKFLYAILEGRLLTHILMAIAQFEVDLFKSRSLEGRQRYRDLGGFWGRKRIEIDSNLKKQVIRRYNAVAGTTKLSKFLAANGIEISPPTVWRRLVEWGVKMRSIS